MPRHRRKEERWGPCRKGFPDPENCPDCTPPLEDRCPETWGPRPCRVLGSHEFHRDGMGTTWWPEQGGDHAADAELVVI